MNCQAPRCQWIAYSGVVSGSHEVPEPSRAICMSCCSAAGVCPNAGTAVAPIIMTRAMAPTTNENSRQRYIHLSSENERVFEREVDLDSKRGGGVTSSYRTAETIE